MSTGSGFGKSILFGEHFVVYGLPAIASALGSQTVATITVNEGKGWTVDDQRPATPGYKKKKFDEAQEAIQNVIDFMKIDTETQKLDIHFAGDLYAASGVGASAAQVASLARALNEEFKMGWNDEQINDAAYEGEKAYHGTPSGIDNAAATFGGLIWFERNLSGGKNTIKSIESKKKIPLVIGNTGLTASTTEVVGDVKKIKEENSEEFDDYLIEYQKISEKAKKALEEGDVETIGKLMNLNHTLLQKITVSCKELDTLVDLARINGALGAKMTGTGRGGLAIAIAPNEETQDKIAKSFEENGFRAWKSTVG
ncbi:MAG: Mevalonate kinase [Candidatus Heimdallarchaeota archaeon LC_3]|nr:MAG: Mevalonate kinase [Candidatus Heimdallarchaeota archaeon LC_3]